MFNICNIAVFFFRVNILNISLVIYLLFNVSRSYIWVLLFEIWVWFWSDFLFLESAGNPDQILIDCMIFPIQLSLIWYITYKVYFANLSQKWNLMSTAVECSSHQKILWSRPHEMAGPKRVKQVRLTSNFIRLALAYNNA